MNDPISLPRAVVEQVLHALKYKGTSPHKVKLPAINALREALEAEQPEPVAWQAHYTDRNGKPAVFTTSHHDLAVENDEQGQPTPLRESVMRQPEPVAWECKAGGLKRLTQRQYEAQSDAIKRHYTRVRQPESVAFCRVEDVFDNDSLLAQMGVKRGDKLYLHRPQPSQPSSDWADRLHLHDKWPFADRTSKIKEIK